MADAQEQRFGRYHPGCVGFPSWVSIMASKTMTIESISHKAVMTALWFRATTQRYAQNSHLVHIRVCDIIALVQSGRSRHMLNHFICVHYLYFNHQLQYTVCLSTLWTFSWPHGISCHTLYLFGIDLMKLNEDRACNLDHMLPYRHINERLVSVCLIKLCVDSTNSWKSCTQMCTSSARIILEFWK